MIREALVPVPTEKGVDLMAQWQAIALNIKPSAAPRNTWISLSSMKSWPSWGRSRIYLAGADLL